MPTYNCPCPVLFKRNTPFGGNTVNSSQSSAMRYSELVRVNTSRNGSSRLVTNNNALSSASLAPPRNAF